MSHRRLLGLVIALTLLLKIILAAWLPMTGDEAYYIVWGKNLDWGYYDQPPMVGWWLFFLLKLGSHPVLLRLPAILMSTCIALGIYRLIRLSESKEKAELTAILYLLAPIHVLFFFIVTDVPLVFFSFATMYFLELGRRKNELSLFAWAGLMLGLAFLSKYFAVFIPLAYAAYLIFERRPKKDWLGLALMGLVALPFVGIHLAWNYSHCWINFLFNLSSRNVHENIDLNKTKDFIFYQIYLITPFLLYYLLKNWKQKKKAVRSIQIFFFVVPISVFLLTSVKIAQGLHWTLSFYPALYLWIGYTFSLKEIKTSLKWMVAYLIPHFIPIIVFAVLPYTTWEGRWFYKNMQLFMHTEDAARNLIPYEKDYYFTSDGYTLSAIMGYRSSKHFSVFGSGSKFGRQDDLITDFRQMEGKKVLIFARGPENMEYWKKYFRSAEIRSFQSYGILYFYLLGEGFRYDIYHKDFLTKIRESYYRIPPQYSPQACYFLDRYFPETSSGVHHF